MTRNLRMLALLAAVLCLLSIPAQAAGGIDLSRDPTLRLTYRSGRTALCGAGFSIYRAASVDETGELTACRDFSSFDFDIRGKNDEAWRALAATLESYVQRRELSPADTGKTGKDGTLSFPTKGKKLSAGLYLVTGERHEQGGYFYDAEPFFVLLPIQDTQRNEWVYDVEASVKSDKTPVPKDDETVRRKVLKVWDDKGFEDSRPREVTVELLKNGKVYDTVKLNAKNNWRYTWDKLDASARWTLTERTVEGYTAAITREGITFVVTNTRKPDKDTPDRPGTPSEPSKPANPSNPSRPSRPGTPTLPQTGAVWWPVGLMAALGLVFLILGTLDRKRDL